ncbi:MAG: alkaline phosphatase family protein [Capsulimonadales bacterium]|nr:alkaline phosphatase family protein [Capsulimonadales bacterium]
MSLNPFLRIFQGERNVKQDRRIDFSLFFALGGLLAVTGTTPARAQDPLVTGRFISPTGTKTDVGSMPINVIVTPDRRFALVSDIGFRQYLTVFDLNSGAKTASLLFPQGSRDGLYYGLAAVRNSDGSYTVYAGQGGNDAVVVLSLTADGKTLSRTATIDGPRKEDIRKLQPGDTPAGVAVAGNRLFVANNTPSVFATMKGLAPVREHGTVSVYDLTTKKEIHRFDFGSISPLPNYPFAIAALNDGSVVFVTSQRDGRVYALATGNVTPTQPPTLLASIETGGHPCALLFNADQSRLYVANATADTVSILDVPSRKVIGTIKLRPETVADLPGVSPVGLALSPDESTLYVACGDLNAVAQVDVRTRRVLGFLPTGWYPTGVAALPNNRRLLVANAKGIDRRLPNPTFTPYDPRRKSDDNFYDLMMIEGTVQWIDLPTPQALPALTRQVLQDARIAQSMVRPKTNPLARFGRKAGKIKHVFYIVRENRTYDQVLGDLKDENGRPLGDGDPNLTLFGEEVTPNVHAIVRRFALFDRFFVSGEASGDGWTWSTRSYANEYVIKNLPYNYSGRSAESRYDFEGQNNGYLVGGHPARDVDGKTLSILGAMPPIVDIADGPNGGIWDAVKRAGLPYRNYGFGLSAGTAPVVPDNYPAHAGLQPEGHDLAGITDYDFRRYDMDYADSEGPLRAGAPFKMETYGKHKATCRFLEFKNEFDQFMAKDPTGESYPAFVMVRFCNDHTNGLSKGAPTPRAYVADNDYAIGQFVELLSKSPIWKSSAVFVIEDDAQDGPDHIDTHRSPCLVISPWVKKGTVDHRFYNTDSVLRTMELLLGLPPLSQYDAIADHFDVWDSAPSNDAPFTAIMPSPSIFQEKVTAGAPGSEWERLLAASAKMDLKRPDSADPVLMNRLLWKSVRGVRSEPPAPVRGKVPAARPDRD